MLIYVCIVCAFYVNEYILGKDTKERIYASLMSSSQAFGKPKLNERSMPASGYNA